MDSEKIIDEPKISRGQLSSQRIKSFRNKGTPYHTLKKGRLCGNPFLEGGWGTSTYEYRVRSGFLGFRVWGLTFGRGGIRSGFRVGLGLGV